MGRWYALYKLPFNQRPGKSRKRIEELQNLHLKISDHYQVFYQMESSSCGAEFLWNMFWARHRLPYLLFGEKDMVRLERSLRIECLILWGMMVWK